MGAGPAREDHRILQELVKHVEVNWHARGVGDVAVRHLAEALRRGNMSLRRIVISCSQQVCRLIVQQPCALHVACPRRLPHPHELPGFPMVECVSPLWTTIDGGAGKSTVTPDYTPINNTLCPFFGYLFNKMEWGYP